MAEHVANGRIQDSPGSADRLIGSIHSSLCPKENAECSRTIRKNQKNTQKPTKIPLFNGSGDQKPEAARVLGKHEPGYWVAQARDCPANLLEIPGWPEDAILGASPEKKQGGKNREVFVSHLTSKRYEEYIVFAVKISVFYF
ncbi:MAG: hypothetical protein PHP44_08625 [Kiritimatiellae bacterium]|nr:hypothetical protein [Kiritimatiellia bacterium]MDD4736157.1 hypothetical protein [Kiritimatiellia bacterium]